MFKLVVLTALFAAAAAEPGLGYSYFGSPLGYSAGYYPAAYSGYYNAPLATTYAAPLAPAVASLPYAPVGHLIKKRSVVAPVATSYIAPTSYVSSGSYIAPGYTSYAGGYTSYAGFPYYRTAPLATTYSYGSPIVSSAVAPAYGAPLAHLIKKRSVAIAPIAPVATSYASYITPTTYANAPIYSSAYASPYYTAAGPYFTSPFYIKK